MLEKDAPATRFHDRPRLAWSDAKGPKGQGDEVGKGGEYNGKEGRREGMGEGSDKEKERGMA